MSTRAITSLFQQSQQILDNVAPSVKDEANKKIVEIKQKIPTKDTVKQMMMDEITSKGPELVCSIEVKNRIDFIYGKMTSKVKKLQNIINKSNEKLLKLQEQLLKINAVILIIEAIFKTLRALIPVLNVIVQVAKVGINFLKGPAADGATTVKLKDQIDKSKAKVQEIKNSIKVFEKKVTKITNKIKIPARIITLALGAIIVIKNTISSVLGLIESFYLKYTLMCNVEGDSIQDEDYADAINNAQINLDNANSTKIILIEDDLLSNTIERIRNANFQVIQYRIA